MRIASPHQRLLSAILFAGSLALVAGVAAWVSAFASAPHPAPARAETRLVAWQAGGDMGERGLWRITSRMDPAELSLARRFDPSRHADLWGRPQGWASLDVSAAPSLPFGVLTADDAQKLNALLPASTDPLPQVAPFYLQAAGPDRERAILCLTQAVYYEAALEPLDGQRAVAQTVLNRVRHPDFPKSICGVVYEGAQQVTGCQFSFTCDGSRERAPIEPYWGRARAVAEAAVSGFVQHEVGTATHYHADYVFPRWGPTLVKIGQIGAHIFYRFPGPIGRSDFFFGRYQGGERQVSMEGPSLAAIAALRAASETGQTAVPAVSAAAFAAPSGRPIPGQIVYGRRVPSRDEIARINAALPPLDGAPASPITPPSS
ncbi:MAG: cell wall hydrolase [Caulobacterales bacterium]